MGDSGSTNPASKGYTPGWNDPPLFSYDSQAAHSNAPRKTNILTKPKRVAFPLQSSSDSTNKLTVDPTLPPSIKPNLPPPPSCCRVPPPVNCDTVKDDVVETEVAESLDKEEVLGKVLSNVEFLISELTSNESYLEHADDIQKKLDIFKKMWREDKLLEDICSKVLKLSNALLSGDSKSADHLQVGLMVDHASLCSPWISAFRLLIRCRSDQKL